MNPDSPKLRKVSPEVTASVPSLAFPVTVLQRGRVFGPITPWELSWLNQNGYLHDNDTVLDASGRPGRDVYEQLNFYLRSGVPVYTSPFQVSCETCGTLFLIQEIGTPAWCPDCGEEMPEQSLAKQMLRRPRREFVLGGHRLASMSGYEWTRLLGQRPELARVAVWDNFRGEDWTALLLQNPALAKYCEWRKLTPDQWTRLVKAGIAEPEWEALARMTPREQLQRLAKDPRLAVFINFSEYKLDEWLDFLRMAPDLASKYTGWKKWMTSSLCRKLLLDPDFPMAPKREFPVELISGRDWMALLSTDPRLAQCCAWRKLAEGIQGLPMPSGALRKIAGADDEALALREDQHSCQVGYPGLWNRRQELWNIGGKIAQQALTQEEFWLVADFLGWENLMQTPASSPKETIALLARHPDFGDVGGLWEKIPPEMLWEVLQRSPSVWQRIGLLVKTAPPELWGRLFLSVRFDDEAERRLVALYPLTPWDVLACRTRKSRALQQRILFWWCIAIIIVALLLIFLHALL